MSRRLGKDGAGVTLTALGHLSDGGIAKWVQQHDREEKRLKEMMGATHATALGFQNLSAAERIGIATGGRSTLDDIAGRTIDPAVIAQASLPNPFLAERPVFEFHSVPFIPPINPAHETNKIVGELLEHQKETDAKKEQAEVKKEAESIVATETSKLGLRYTKAGFWSAVVIAVLSMGITLWVYFDQKADAAENAKATAANEKVASAEIAKQRAENRELIELLRKSIESRTSPAPAVKKSGQK